MILALDNPSETVELLFHIQMVSFIHPSEEIEYYSTITFRKTVIVISSNNSNLHEIKEGKSNCIDSRKDISTQRKE
jgi:hypothetical protein